MRAFSIAAVLCLGGFAALHAQDVADLERQIATLGRQLRFENAKEAAEAERVAASGGVDRMRSLLTAYTAATLTALPDAPAPMLQARLSSAYSPWAPTPHEAEPYTATTPEVFRAARTGRRVVLVSWLIWIGGRGSPNSRFLLQAYTESAGKYALAAETGELLTDHSEFVKMVPAQRPDEVWIIVYGTRFGSTRNDLAAALYAFDGTTFKSRWAEPNLPDGEIRFVSDGVVLEYREYFAAGPNWRNIQEQLVYTPSGLITKVRREISR
jgi:hypothetical protein